jgi:uncharacterized membrane protein HdeD (DUF308 family)
MSGMQTLVRHRWMMVVRGALAGAFGLTLLGWPGITLSLVVVLFAAYAIADGIWAIVAAARVREHALDVWPVALEGLVGVVIGIVAFASPLRVPREAIVMIGVWGLVTGVLELLAAARVPRNTRERWLLTTGGLTSVFLAVLVLMLPHADLETVVALIGVYALTFGIVMALGAVNVTRARPRTAHAQPRA